MEKLFVNKELSASIRVVRDGEEILFYAKDVANAFGYINTKSALGLGLGLMNLSHLH
jgi:prophage antirepressor-like protein